MSRVGEGGPLVKRDSGSVIPSKKEIIKDLVKWFATEYGLDLLESAFESIDTMKLVDMWKKRQQRQLAAKSGGGGAIVLLALVALAGKKRKR